METLGSALVMSSLPSARTGGVSDIKVELVSGSGDSQNQSWAWCAVECSRRETVNVAVRLRRLWRCTVGELIDDISSMES